MSEQRKQNPLLYLLLLLLSPELFFIGMVYTPSTFAMCFILASHIFIRAVVTKPNEKSSIKLICLSLLSILSFGFGVACRWDTGFYGLVIFIDIVFSNNARGFFSRQHQTYLLKCTIWGVLSVGMAFFFIFISGSNFSEIIYTLTKGGKHIQAAHNQLPLASLAALQTFLTPGMIVFGAIGFIYCCMFRKRIIFMLLCAICPFIPVLFTGSPKRLITAFPNIFFLAIIGFLLIWNLKIQKKQNMILFRTLICLLIIGPWIVGAQIKSSQTAWGPNFNIKSPSFIALENGKNKFNLSIGSGFPIPSDEGPRPVFGYAAVLLGGKWRALVTKLDNERKLVIEKGLADNLPILQDGSNSLLAIHLLNKGFHTRDPYQEIKRTYVNTSTNQTIDTYSLHSSKKIFMKKALLRLPQESNQFILYSSYSSNIRKLYRRYPQCILEPIGPYSVIIDLRKYIESL